MKATIHLGDCRDVLSTLPDRSVQSCVTSPPYWGLRDYGMDGQLGLEQTPDDYVSEMVDVFREVRRVLADDGTLWLNLGDSYAAQGGSHEDREDNQTGVGARRMHSLGGGDKGVRRPPSGLKPKDLIGIPWRVAFALQSDGWWLRQDIVWCLSGGMWVYARTQKGDAPVMVKDLARLDPSTVQLWNGERWTQLLGMSTSERRGTELEIVLRSGERISCTPTHKFPTKQGLKEASELSVGDTLLSCRLPEPDSPRDCSIDEDAAWFAGLYLAEGSRSGDTIQISGHAKETERWERVQKIAAKFGGYTTVTVDGNRQAIRVYGKVLNAILYELVFGRTARDKGFAPVVWHYSDLFLAAMVDGYLSGDGHLDGDRWRLGFCRNYRLERDLRTACARLGYTLTLKPTTSKFDGKRVPSFQGELRKSRGGHPNERDRNEIMEIRKARCRKVYDLGVADEPHLFALASGVLTHNSKPNPMPESVTDRCTKAHEYVFLLTKSARYYYNAEAIAERSLGVGATAIRFGGNKYGDSEDQMHATKSGNPYTDSGTRNRRSVWTISTKSFTGAHFAVMPVDLAEPCVLAGSRPGDTVLDPFVGAGTTAVVALRHQRNFIGSELNPEYAAIAEQRVADDQPLFNEVEVLPLPSMTDETGE